MSFEWWRALNTVERLERGLADKSGGNDALGAERLEKLIRQYDLREFEEHLSVYLSSLGIDRATYQRILNQEEESVRPPKPDWAQAVDNALRMFRWTSRPSTFRSFAEPFVHYANDQMKKTLIKNDLFCRIIENETFDETISPFLPGTNLESNIIVECTPTLVLLINEIAEESNTLKKDAAPINGLLDKIQDLSYYTQLFNRFPVLAKKIGQTVLSSLESSLDMCVNFFRDRVDIIGLLVSEECGNVVRIEAAGDSHRRGRTVRQLSFESGEKIFYKPRSAKINKEYNKLLERIRHLLPRDLIPGVPSYIWNEGDCHYWEADVVGRPCKSENEIRLFYERVGALLAIAYCLGSSDLHYENIIAVGDRPVFVDLETLIQPYIRDELWESFGGIWSGETLMRSVLSSGLLPDPLFDLAEDENENEAKILYDLSGLADVSLYKFKQNNTELTWDERGLPRIRPGERFGEKANNIPTLDQKTMRTTLYHEQIVSGFDRLYHVVLLNRDVFDKFLAALQAEECRVVLWQTRFYGEILAVARQPDLLESGLAQDRLFSLIWRRLDRDMNRFATVAKSEVSQLDAGDFPYFTIPGGSVQVRDYLGREVLSVDMTSVANVQYRLERMSESDLEFQRWLLRASLMQPESVSVLPVLDNRPIGPKLGSISNANGKELNLAQALGSRILEIGYGSDSDTWLSIRPVGNVGWRIQDAGRDLYGGRLGIALFYSFLAELTGVKTWRTTAAQLVDPVLSAIEGFDDDYASSLSRSGGMGLYTGLAGALYSLTQMTKWGEIDASEEIEQILKYMSERVVAENERRLDLLSGSAGIVRACLSAWSASSDGRARELAIRYSDHLAAEVVRMGGFDRVAWITPIERYPISGYGHGAAGIASTLALCQTVFRLDGRYDSVIRGALRFEETSYDPQGERWLELRSNGRDPMIAWCHGSAGIAYSRLEIIESDVDSDIVRLAEKHLLWTLPGIFRDLKQGHLTTDDCLCHGKSGVLWIVRDIHQSGLLAPDQAEIYLKMEREYVDSFSLRGVYSGVPGGLEIADLMTGLSGTGLFLLKSGGFRVPQVLSGGLSC